MNSHYYAINYLYYIVASMINSDFRDWTGGLRLRLDWAESSLLTVGGVGCECSIAAVWESGLLAGFVLLSFATKLSIV
jgi:hypothetical protein